MRDTIFNQLIGDQSVVYASALRLFYWLLILFW